MTNKPLTEAEDSRPVVAVAILHRDNQFLMQLRDDNPNIFYPGHWAFFGGHLEPGEDPETGVRRELLEEIGYCPLQLTLFTQHNDEKAIRYIYWGELGVDLKELVLTEGMDMALVTEEDVTRGDRYSTRINQVRPLGPPHQKILLNFIRSRNHL